MRRRPSFPHARVILESSQSRMHLHPGRSRTIRVHPPHLEAELLKEHMVHRGKLDEVIARRELERQVKLKIDRVDALEDGQARSGGGEMMEGVPLAAFTVDLKDVYPTADVAELLHDPIQAEQWSSEVAVRASNPSARLESMG